MDEDIFCGSCGEGIWFSEVFCMQCGEPNRLFKMEVFKAEYDGKNVLEVMVEEGCRFGHPGIQEDIKGDDKEIYLEHPMFNMGRPDARSGRIFNGSTVLSRLLLLTERKTLLCLLS